jgi:hypothetical protein
MKTRKGIKYKTRNKRAKLLNTRKGLKHKGRHGRRKRTFKIMSGGTSALDTLKSGANRSAKTLARTTTKAMDLVTQTGERSVEIAGSSVNLALNITHGTVDTANIAFLTVNTVLQRCLNFIKKRFEESYTQISQCKNHKYTDDGDCIASCIIPIITKFSKNFYRRRPTEFANLIKSINNTRALIDKSIDYFCKRGFIFGRICSTDIIRQKTEAKLIYSTLMEKVGVIKAEELAYETSVFAKITAGSDCSSITPLCLEYIDRLCTPFQKILGINEYMKQQEDLLLLWNKKIEDAKQKAEFDRFLKQIGTTIDKAKKAQAIMDKRKEQKKAQNEKIQKVESLLKKNSEIEKYEREIFFIEQNADIANSILISEKIITGTKSKIDILKGTINQLTGKNGNTLKANVIEAKSQREIELKEEETKLKEETIKLEEETIKSKELEAILTREGQFGTTGLIEQLKNKIKKIEDNQKKEAEEAAAAAAAAETQLKAPIVLTDAEASASVKAKVIAEQAAAESVKAEQEAEQEAKAAEEKGAAEAAAEMTLSEKNVTNSAAKAATNASAKAATNASAKAATNAAAVNAAAKAATNAAAVNAA